MFDRRLRLLSLLLFGLLPGSSSDPVPLILIKLAIPIEVKTFKQAGKVLFPLANDGRLHAVNVKSLVSATLRIKVADDIQGIATVQALFCVAITPPAHHQYIEPVLWLGSLWMTIVSLPDLATNRNHPGTLGVDQAVAGTVFKTQESLAGLAVQCAPAVMLVVSAALVLLNTIAPLGAGLAGQGCLQLFSLFADKAVQFDIALSCRTYF